MAQLRHVQHLRRENGGLPEDFLVRVTGRYYTHEIVAKHMIEALLESAKGRCQEGSTIRVVDPFAGDGRLILWLLEAWQSNELPAVHWELALWDLEAKGLAVAQSRLKTLATRQRGVRFTCLASDSFKLGRDNDVPFEIVISNPPWELLKPDRRELQQFDKATRTAYVEQMREYDRFLAESYPASQPKQKFAGWGTNLSRVGLDLCRRYLLHRWTTWNCNASFVLGGWSVCSAATANDDQLTSCRCRLLSG